MFDFISEFGDTGNEEQQCNPHQEIKRINRSSSMGSERLMSNNVQGISLSQETDGPNANTSRITGARNTPHFTPITRFSETHKVNQNSHESSTTNLNENIDYKNLPKDPLYDNFCNDRNSLGNSQPINLETGNELAPISPPKALHSSFISHYIDPYENQS